MWFNPAKTRMPSRDEALPGRDQPLDVDSRHYVTDRPIKPPFPPESEWFVLGMGCFWGAEQCFWDIEGVYTTAVGYAAGHTPNPTYQEVCTGLTGHNEVVLVVYDPKKVSFETLARTFFESHDPTQLMRQGNDVGTQYRSGLYLPLAEQQSVARELAERYQQALNRAGKGELVTEIEGEVTFYYAETYHQQYLAKNPGGYCGLGGTGVPCPGSGS